MVLAAMTWEAFKFWSVHSFLPLLGKVILCIVIWFVGKKLIGWIMGLINKAFDKTHMDPSVSGFLSSLIRFALYALMIVSFFGILGVATASVASVVASIGVTIGLALQGSLSNFAGGVLILVLKPFKVGDFIDTNGVSGSVVQIDIFYTKIRTPDFKDIMIPNGSLMNSTVTNVSAQNTRRHDIVASASYSADIDKVKQVLTDIVKNTDLVLQDHEISVTVANYAASSIDYNIRFWVDASKYWDAKFYVTEQIKKAFDANGIEIPFNQLDVHFDQQSK